MHRLSISLIGAVLAVAWAGSAAAQPFSLYFIEQQAPRTYFGDLEWADFDSDGDFDLFLSGTTTFPSAPTPLTDLQADARHTTIVTPSGPGLRIVFESMLSAQPLGIWLSSALPADVNADGDLDLIASGASAGPGVWSPASIYLQNQGAGQFEALPLDIEPLFAGASSWFDVNNDGWPDLLTSGISASGEFRTLLYLNSSTGLSPAEVDIPGLANASIAVADFDLDGDMDVALSGRLQEGTFTTRLYRNEDGQLEDTGFPLQGVAYGSLDWGDYDADGDPDLLLSGAQPGPLVLEGVMLIYRNNGGDLVATQPDLPTLVAGAARWGDYDHDGHLDVVWTGSEDVYAKGATGVHRNESGTFRRATILPGTFPGNVIWGDHDSDGDLDLTLQGLNPEFVPTLIQYQNDNRLVNLPPSAPEGLQSVVTGNDVVLSWQRSSDAVTSAEALTYNLRLGSQPGTADILHPGSDPATGRRLYSRPGNVDANLQWPLRNLTPGTYFWSVQAIDGSYTGSAFASEGSFTIGTGGGSDVTTDTDQSTNLPDRFAVLGAYPNPSSDAVRVRLSLPDPARLSVEIFDVVGSTVRVLDAVNVEAGHHEITWDGRDSGGNPVAAGVYLARIMTNGGWTGTTSMVVLR